MSMNICSIVAQKEKGPTASKLLFAHLNGEIDSTEFATRRDEITSEKDRIQNSINLLDRRVNERLTEFEEKFDYAEKAQERFNSKVPRTQHDVLAYMGSNFILHNKVLSLDMENILEGVRVASKAVKVLNNTFEPVKNGYKQEQFAQMYANCPVLGAYPESNRS